MSQIYLVDGPIYREDIVKNAKILEEHELSNRIAQMQLENEEFTKLIYLGRPARKDVLVRLKEIAVALECHPQFPFFKLATVEHTITECLRNPDHRTTSRYIDTMNEWLKAKGQKLSYMKNSDFTAFKETVLRHLGASK